MNRKRIDFFNFADFQRLNDLIYGDVNRRCYTSTQMVSRIHRYSTHLSKFYDSPDKFDDFKYYICMSFSWVCAFANSIGIDLDKEVGKRFPGVCPYCGLATCDCGPVKAKSRLVITPVTYQSVFVFQKKLASIYPHNKLTSSVIHLMQETGEVDEKWENFTSTHRPEIFNDVVEELVDVIAWLCAVATLSRINISSEMAEQFHNGCCNCSNTPCRCGYVVAGSIPVSKLP